MLKFDPRNPFPSSSHGEIAYAAEQAHSAAADAWLGLNLAAVEREISERGCRLRAPGETQELWLGLAVSSLLTPYTEIKRVLEAVGCGGKSTVVDLGAAYGRMGFVVARCFPGARFVGYEYVGERVREGNRALRLFEWSMGVDIRLQHADLASPDFKPMAADIYLIYDYGTMKAIEKTLHDLRRIALEKEFTLIARGARCRSVIRARHPWLTEDGRGPFSERISLYRSQSPMQART